MKLLTDTSLTDASSSNIFRKLRLIYLEIIHFLFNYRPVVLGNAVRNIPNLNVNLNVLRDAFDISRRTKGIVVSLCHPRGEK